MNEAIQNEVQRLINEFRNRIGGKAVRHQYAPAKHQIASLAKLGLTEYMVAGFGNGDADVVIRAAVDAPHMVGGMVDGEGDVAMTSGSALWKLLNPPATEPEPAPVSDQSADMKNETETIIEPDPARIYKVMKFDDRLNFERAQQRFVTAPELDYRGAASVISKFIERGELSLEVYTGIRGSGRVGSVIRMTPSGSVTTDVDAQETPELRYILEAMHNALKRRWQLEGVITAAEAVAAYGLSESAVRQAINRGQVAGRKSGNTWVVLRSDAEVQWGKSE